MAHNLTQLSLYHQHPQPTLAARLVAICLIAGLGLCVTPSTAQTDFSIASKGPDLAAQYKIEFDRWMLEAYEGDADAQFKVGVLYTNSQFREPDFEQAAYWYKQAARQGHVLAQYNLGHQYLTGQGVRKSEKEAMDWWQKAAEQDHALAQFNLGRANYLGIGMAQDHNRARYWFERATENGEPKSAQILTELGWDDNLDKLLAKAAKRDTRPEPPSATRDAPFESRVTPADAAALEQTQPKPPTQTVPRTQPEQVTSSADRTETPKPIANSQQSRPSISATPQPQTGSTESTTTNNTGPSRFSILDDSQPQPATSPTSTGPTVAQTTPQYSPKPTPRVEPLQAPAQQSREQTSKKPANESAEQVAKQTQPAETRANQAVEEPQPEERQTATSKRQDIPTALLEEPRVAVSTQPPAPQSLALFSNPEVRSVLIALVTDIDLIKVIKVRKEWSIVSHLDGFPVWVHSDYLILDGEVATIDGSRVNARSVPIISKDTKLDRFKDNELVELLGQRGEWYRVKSPPRFEAWVKTEELKALQDAREIRLQSSADDWLFSQPDSRFTLQLASFDDPSKTAQFLSSSLLANDPELKQFESERDGTQWTYFLYGSYVDEAQAEAAKAQIRQPKAWARNIKPLKENRCLAWKTLIPAPPALNMYCQGR